MDSLLKHIPKADLIPLRNNEKEPAVTGWREKSYTYMALVYTNKGFLCGGDYIVLDWDAYKDETGSITLENLVNTFDTFTVRTGRGGFHTYHKMTDKTRKWKGRCGYMGLIDCRTLGNYVVAPGSIVDGNSYTVVHDVPLKSIEEGECPHLNEMDEYFTSDDPVFDGKNVDISPEIIEALEKDFTNIKWKTEYSFDCDQRGRNSKCPLCEQTHTSNYFNVFSGGECVFVKNFSQKCKAKCIKDDRITGFAFKLTPEEIKEMAEMEKADKKKKKLEDRQSDYEGAMAFYTWATTENGMAMVRIGKEIIWYNPIEKLWVPEYKSIKPFLNKCPHIDDQYRGMDKNQNALLNQLEHIIPIDNTWYTNVAEVQKGFLPLKSYVWDFANKKAVDYEPKYKFFHKLNIDYDETADTEDVKFKLFTNLFHRDDVEYLMKMIARGIAGHGDKNMFFFVGDGNSGKGFFELAFRKLLGPLLGTITADNLVHKKNVQDPAKALSFLVKVKDTRLCMGQEVKMEEQISGTVVKKFASGGDVIQARVNHKDEIDFTFSALTILCANDIPKINGLDDAFKNRIGYFEMEKVFLEAYMDYRGIKERVLIDPTLKDIWIHKPETMAGLLKLMIDSYVSDRPEMPEHLKQVANERHEDSGDDLVLQISELFEHTYETDEEGAFKLDANGNKVPILNSGKVQFITSKALFDKCTRKGIQVSATKLGTTMRALGYPSKDKKIAGKSIRVFENIKFPGHDDY